MVAPNRKPNGVAEPIRPSWPLSSPHSWPTLGSRNAITAASMPSKV